MNVGLQVISPIASGSLLTKVDNAFREFVQIGLVQDTPYRVFGAQATGSSPVSVAFREGPDVVCPQRPNTIAKSLAIGNPAGLRYSWYAVRRYLDVIRDAGAAGRF